MKNQNLNPTSFIHIIDSPIGPLTLTANERALTSLDWGRPYNVHSLKPSQPLLKEAAAQLHSYFLGRLTQFNLPLEPQGTEFQKQVWQELLKIPYGTFISYSEQARRLGKPLASRAVGSANGKNPLGIFIPCHRVVGASGQLTGFAGGLKIKQALLTLEGLTVVVTPKLAKATVRSTPQESSDCSALFQTSTPRA